MKRVLTILMLFVSVSIFANEEAHPVQSEVFVFESGDSTFIRVVFEPQKDWMVYDSIAGEGPVPLTFDCIYCKNVELVEVQKPDLHKKHDEIFEVDIYYFKEKVEYKLVFKTIDKSKPTTISGAYEFMTCNLTSGVCLRPEVRQFSNYQ